MFMKSSTALKKTVGNDGSTSFLEGFCRCGDCVFGGVDFAGVYFVGISFLRGLDDGGAVVVVVVGLALIVV